MQGSCAVHCFCSGYLRNGSLVLAFYILSLIIYPNCQCMQLFLVSYSFFIFCCSKRCFSTYKQSCKASHIPAYLTMKCRTKHRSCRKVSRSELEPKILTFQWLIGENLSSFVNNITSETHYTGCKSYLRFLMLGS